MVPSEPVCAHTGAAAQHNSSAEITASETEDNRRGTSFISSPYVGVAGFSDADFKNAKVREFFTRPHNQTVV